MCAAPWLPGWSPSSSRTAETKKRECLTGFFGYNMAVGGGDLATSHFLVTNYILPLCPKIKIVGVSVDLNQYAGSSQTETGSLYTTFTQSKGSQYDRNHRFWQEGRSNDFLPAILRVPIPQTGPSTTSIDSLGLIKFNCMGWGDAVFFGDTSWDLNNPYVAPNWQLTQDIINQCGKKNVHVLFVVFPFNPLNRTTNFFNALGPSQRTAKTLVEKFADCAANNPHVHFYDANNYGNHDYTNDDAFDYLHLCINGARKLSTRIDSLLNAVVPAH